MICASVILLVFVELYFSNFVILGCKINCILTMIMISANLDLLSIIVCYICLLVIYLEGVSL